MFRSVLKVTHNVKFSGWEVSRNDTDVVSVVNKNLDAIYFDLIYPTYYNGKDAIELKSYSDLTTLNLPLTERGM